MRYDPPRAVSRRARKWLAALAAAPLVATGALAQTAPTTQAPPAAQAAPPQLPVDAWAAGIKVNLQLEGGVVFNTAGPGNGENFGQLFTDQSNNFQLNQALVTVQRTPDPKAAL